MNAIARQIVISLALGGTGQLALACDASQPACKDINTLLERLQYRERLLDGQRLCMDGAQRRSPEALDKSGVLRALGVQDKQAVMAEASEAFDRFKSIACGGEEVIQVLLQMYRVELAQRLKPEEIEALARSGDVPSEEIRRSVSAAAGRKAGRMLDAMERIAMGEYEAVLRPHTSLGMKEAGACNVGQGEASEKSCKVSK